MGAPRRPLDKPFEIYMLVLCLVYGLGVIIGGPKPVSIQATLDPLLIQFWSWMLFLGSTAGLLGLLWRGRLVTSYAVEQTGVIVCGGATLIYGIGVIGFAGPGGTFAAGLSFAFTLACFDRAWVIWRFTRELVKITKE